MVVMRQIIDPPSFTPTPFGLLTVAEYPPVAGPHWQNGVTYQALCPSTLVSPTSTTATTYNDCIAITGAGSPPPPAALSGTVARSTRGALPFVVYAEFDCAPVGVDALDIANRALSMTEAYQVERAVWTGRAGAVNNIVMPHLASSAQILDGDGVIVQTAAVDVGVTGTGSPYVNGDLPNIANAVGLLEEALSDCYTGIGVIHIPEMAAPTAYAWTEINGGTMRTINGNKVAVGGGYPGTSPAGASRTGNTCWIYATGNVFVLRSDVRVRAPDMAASLDRTTNTRKMIAERTYVVGWDCCHFAIQANLGVPKGT